MNLINKITNMNVEKKVYIIKISGLYSGIFSESKEEILKLWEIFNEGNFRRLKSERDWDDDNERFYWPKELKVSLESKRVYLHENEERALKAKKAHKHAKKVGIISKKKKPK